MSQILFLETLFQPGEATCYTESPHGYRVSLAPTEASLFFCINALHPSADLNPTKDWHSAGLPRRADHNVVSFRNFLLEFDQGSLEEQQRLVLSKIPVSAITFSGSKSLHFLISLKDPLHSLTEYKHVARRLFKLFPNADSSCRNPSRLSRLPQVLRPDTGRMQELRYLGQRLDNETFLNCLPQVDMRTYPQRSVEDTLEYVTPLLMAAAFKPNETMEEFGIQSRNAFFYWLGKRLDDVSADLKRRQKFVDLAYNNMYDVKDFSLEEAYMASRVKN